MILEKSVTILYEYMGLTGWAFGFYFVAVKGDLMGLLLMMIGLGFGLYAEVRKG